MLALLVYAAFTEVTVANLIGGYEYGDVNGFAGGGHVEVVRRYGRVALGLEGDLLGFGEDAYENPDARHGLALRAGGIARVYSELDGPREFKMGGWIEGGAGVERVSLDWEDRTAVRRDLVFGLGVEWIGQLHKKVETLSMYYALRIVVARDEGPPAEDAVQPYDYGVFLNWGLRVAW